MKKFRKIVFVILIAIIVLYSVFYFGGQFAETYQLNKLERAYQVDPTESFEYSTELVFVTGLMEATGRYTEAQPFIEKYLQVILDDVGSWKEDSDKFSGSMVAIKVVNPYLFLLFDTETNLYKSSADGFFYDGLDYLDRQYDSLFLTGQLEAKETELMACAYANFLPYATEREKVYDLKAITDRIDGLMSGSPLKCVYVTQDDLEVVRDFAREVSKGESVLMKPAELLSADGFGFGMVQSVEFITLEKKINSDLVDRFLYKYVYVPIGQWVYFWGRNF